MSTYTTPCREDADWATKWGPSGKTAKQKAAQDCFDRGYYNATVQDCGGWKFKAGCAGQVPEGWSKPYSNESAQEEGYTDRNAAMDANCRSKGFAGSDPNNWQDKGEWFYSLKCINPISTTDPQPQPTQTQPTPTPAPAPTTVIQPVQDQPAQVKPPVSTVEKKDDKTALIVGIVIGVILLLAVIVVVVIIVVKKKGAAASAEYEQMIYPDFMI